MSVENKVVVITGASSGIGEATAKLLASNGAAVVLGARRGERLQEISQEIINNGGKAAYRVTDVTDTEDLKQLVSLAKELTEELKANESIDWQYKESGRARMRTVVKRLLRKYKYPPKEVKEAMNIVLKQCEYWAENRAEFY